MSPSRPRPWHEAQYECPCGAMRTVQYGVAPADRSVGIATAYVEEVFFTACDCGVSLTEAEAEALADRDLENMVASYGDREHDE